MITESKSPVNLSELLIFTLDIEKGNFHYFFTDPSVNKNLR